MAENLYSKSHKSVSDEYRKGYAQIRWNWDKDKVPRWARRWEIHNGVMCLFDFPEEEEFNER